ncbi:starvation-inducible DNA-binding protein [Mariniflexile fucanivorans]|uniref:Starvation-inducible DNA-binding protein n=1 Tax=Mariniflexile fucanivorans TaxID=264023 RepID=A0A4R1RJ09_9FLAO|nr:DNA starvation/stationary phase protection protein [Mariniflexile fucanivorans]TCL66094.1 starvation-inducible DNA-binding protein [Mariniflexile fucanivorans]
MKTDIGIKEKNLTSNVKHLTAVLSNAMILYVKTRKFHWNVAGPSFMELHKLFEDQYNDLEHDIDEIAERISKLGEKPIGTMKEFIKHGSLKESETNPSQKVMIEELLSDHETVVKELREIINTVEEDTDDMGTADFLTALLQSHESKAWVLRKYTK